MAERSGPGPHALLCAVLLGTSVWPISTLLLHRANTLHDNGRWHSSKLDLELGVVGAVSFVTTRRALHGNRLDLGTWHGYQEVVLRTPVALREVELRLRLANGGYLVVLLEHTPDAFSGFRLSADPRRPSACLAGTSEGRFTRREPIGLAPLDARWHRVAARAAAGRWILSLDGREIGTCGRAGDEPTGFGVRGGPRRGTFVDDITIRTARGEVLYEDFENRRYQAAVAGAVLLAAAVALAVTALSRPRRARVSRWVPAEAALLSLTLIAWMALVVDTVRLWPSYPENIEPRGHPSRIESEAEALRRLASAHPPGPPTPGVRRVVFLGSSQTWGAGAARAGDAWIARLERRWNTEAPPGRRYELINAGISGLESHRVRELYETRWISWRPESVVVVLGHNDPDAERLAREVTALWRTNRERGIRTVLLPEPESAEKRSGRRPVATTHDAIRAVASRHGIPLVEVQDALRARSDEGFVWWDRVHLTSFGHALVADAVDAQRLAILPPAHQLGQ